MPPPCRFASFVSTPTIRFGDTKIYFHEAARLYGELLAPFAAPSVIAERLAAIEDANLRLYGYGVKGFIISMMETALEIAGEKLNAAAMGKILEIGRDLMRHPIELLDGVAEALGPLAERAPLALVTKGDLFHQEMKLAASGVGDRFSGIEIVSEKTADVYARIFHRHGAEPGEAVMAGNSLRSDVWPALAAGAWAAHIPHEFEWARERADDPAGHPRFRRLASLAELPEWVDRLNRA